MVHDNKLELLNLDNYQVKMVLVKNDLLDEFDQKMIDNY